MDIPRRGGTTRVSAIAVSLLVAISSRFNLEDARGEDRQRSKTSGQLKGIDLEGRLHHLGDDGGTKAVVVVFLATECPISNSYLPLLSHLKASHRRRGVEVYGVISDHSVSRSEAVTHRARYPITFPVLFDASGELRRCLSPTHTPHAFVLDDQGRPLYHGAIDDLYVELGRKKQQATKHYLVDAIEAALSQKPIAVRATKPVGCLLEKPPDKSKAGSVTYARDIAPIIQANCASCHRPGQAGPFSLLTYNDVNSHALQIAEVTRSRYMPPWKPEPGFGRFLDERRLTEHQISLLEVWAKSGKPKGDAQDLPPKPQFTDGWKLGKPDLILEMRETFQLPARGPDIRQYFVIPMNLRQNRLVATIDFQPGVPKVVHHASFYLDTSGAARKLDARDPTPGYEGFGGPGFYNSGSLRSWLPGMKPRRLPKGMGRPVPRGSDLVVEIHYQLSGKPERDRSTVGVYFAPRSAKQFVMELLICDKRLEIPAGARRHRHRSTYTLPVDAVLLDVAPHMHLLGQEMKAVATLPDKSVRPLVWVKDWDFNWQSQYSYARPIQLPKGTRIDVDAWYDNSSKNPLNPNSPPKVVRWGEDSTDEMSICHFQYTCATLRELRTMSDHHGRYLAYQEQQFQQLRGQRTP